MLPLMVARTIEPVVALHPEHRVRQRLLDDAVELELVALRLFSLATFTHASSVSSTPAFTSDRAREHALRHLVHACRLRRLVSGCPASRNTGSSVGVSSARRRRAASERRLPGRRPGARGRRPGGAGYTSSGKSVQCVCPCAGALRARSGASSRHLERERRTSSFWPVLGEHRVERLGLRHGAREAVEQKAVRCSRARRVRSSMRPMTTSSGTSPPAAMVCDELGRERPVGLRARGACRRSRPAECRTWRRRPSPACPSPHPAGRRRRARMAMLVPPYRGCVRSRAAAAREALVVARDEVRLDLVHGVERDADDDHDRRAAPAERDVERLADDRSARCTRPRRRATPPNVMRVSTLSM